MSENNVSRLVLKRCTITGSCVSITNGWVNFQIFETAVHDIEIIVEIDILLTGHRIRDYVEQRISLQWWGLFSYRYS